MGRRKREHTLHQKLMMLVWLNACIFLLIAGVGVHLSQRIYRQDMETETSNVFQATFVNLENTLHFVDNIAMNLINDRTVKDALRAVNKNSDGRYVLVDDLYYRIITASLIANDAVSIIVLDQDQRQYATGSLTRNLSEDEQETMKRLLGERSSKTMPIWFTREEEKELAYARQIYDTPFGGHAPLGVLLITIDLDKMMVQHSGGSLARGTIVMTYRDQPVYASDSGVWDQPDRVTKMKSGQESGYFVVAGTSGYEDVGYVGYEAESMLVTSVNAMVIFFTLSILFILIMSFLMTVRIVRQITSPVAFFSRNMKSVEKGCFSTQINMKELDCDITELRELAGNFNLMTGEIKRLVQDNYLRTIKEKEYQIKVLQYQINPHFLYNTLDAVNWLAMDSDRPEISSMVQALATIFREATRQPQYMIPLREELSLLACYVTIQKIRLEERLQFTFAIPDDCLELKLPKLSLQPILENAVKYGAERTLKPCEIHISAKRRGDCLFVFVGDNGPGISKEILTGIREHKIGGSTGIGLINIEERVQMLGGKKSGMRLYSSRRRGTWIRLAIVQEKEEEG